ncbi:hypothetical protein [Aeromonas dhakensis]|uniref:hypothetical protein n=1 Tax=Aeromonas dhakensis TaxID=196024 RepID=UPI002379F1C9|nr:hypothetical protein [Aeromonas dhakensis]MDD9210038.1 hypothetical protein [Aeromonas dhakensis]
MNLNRLELALERLRASDWEHFEQISSTFLIDEFEQLRTVAAPSGDGGRDSELFSPQGESKVVAQYSVTKNWKAKIKQTVERLNKTHPSVTILIYLSNQVIGAEADDIRKELRVKHGIALDIRDRNWFCERVNVSINRQEAAEKLACIIVDPYLSSKGVAPSVSPELNTPESIAAFTFLGLQWQDDVREKGLTKLAFDALVRSALIGTNSDNKIGKPELHSKISKIFPNHKPDIISIHVESAIRRLGKSAIKKWPGDQYCLSHDENIKFNEYRIANTLAENELFDAVLNISEILLDSHDIDTTHKNEVASHLRTVVDKVLLERSQAFAMAVQTGALAALADTDFKSTISTEIAASTLPKQKGTDWLSVFRIGIKQILMSDNPAIQAYLRALADSYTLMAFLQQTPDVQRAVEKMFSHGNLWLDTTILLPLIADTLFTDDINKGRFSRMIDAARDAGLKLHVTNGILEEVERHMNRALTCSRMNSSSWQGNIPYLLEQYLSSGRGREGFDSWLKNFRGDSRPLDDLAEYVLETFGVSFKSLEKERDSAPADLRNALQIIWLDRYKRRQEKYQTHLDEMAIDKLISHDIECYSGVLQLRTQEKKSPFGYSAWWLTVDPVAFDLKNRLQPMMTNPPPDSPVMSADFLVNYLAIGPLRNKISKKDESQLPILMLLGSASKLTPELIEEASALREKLKELPERLIRREVRDRLDQAKAKIGPIATQGMETIVESIDF